MRSLFAPAVVLALTAVAGVRADDKPKPPDTPAEKWKAIQKESDDARQELRKKLDEIGRGEEAATKREAVLKDYTAAGVKRQEAALALVRGDPSSALAGEVLVWVAMRSRDDTRNAAVELLIQHHPTNPKVGELLIPLGQDERYDEGGEIKALTALLASVEKSTDATVVGRAAVVKAWRALKLSQKADVEKNPKADELAAAAEKAFEAAAKGFGKVKVYGFETSPTVAETAAGELFELRNLRIGKPAPEIEGEDLDGMKFKLSDYKGKVVMLDFWGDW